MLLNHEEDSPGMQNACQYGTVSDVERLLAFFRPVASPADIRPLMRWALIGGNVPVAAWLLTMARPWVGDSAVHPFTADVIQHRNPHVYQLLILDAKKTVLSKFPDAFDNPQASALLCALIQLDLVVEAKACDLLDQVLCLGVDDWADFTRYLMRAVICHNFGKGLLRMIRGYGQYGILHPAIAFEKSLSYYATDLCLRACLGVLPYPHFFRMPSRVCAEDLRVLLSYGGCLTPEEINRSFQYSLRHRGHWRLSYAKIIYEVRRRDVWLRLHKESLEDEFSVTLGEDPTTTPQFLLDAYAWLCEMYIAAKQRLAELLHPLVMHHLYKPGTGSRYFAAKARFEAEAGGVSKL